MYHPVSTDRTCIIHSLGTAGTNSKSAVCPGPISIWAGRMVAIRIVGVKRWLVLRGIVETRIAPPLSARSPRPDGAHTGRPVAMEIIDLDLPKRERQRSIKADDRSITDRRIATSRERFTAVFGERPPARRLLEASTEREWGAAHLESLGHEVIVADPNYAPMYAKHRPRDDGPVGPEAAVGHEEVQVRMPVGARAVRLQTGDDADRERALAGERANGGRDGAGSDAGDLAEQAAAIEAVRAQSLGDGEHHLPMRHRCEERGVEPLRPDRQPFGVAARAEIPAFAREREQVLVGTGVAADAGEAVLQHAAGKELVGDLRHDGAPRAVLARKALIVDRLQAVQVVRHQLKERLRLGAPGFVDAARRRRRAGHVRSRTGERRAQARLGRGPSPFDCATGCFDATSARRRPNDACCCRADPRSAHCAASGGPLAAEAGVEVVE